MSEGETLRELRSREVLWHHGDPEAEYAAAREGVGVMDRSRRGRWRITGRDPEKILGGVLTCSIPSPAETGEGGGVRGAGVYGAVLTPKGKLVTDVRLFPRGFWGDAFFLEIAAAGVEGLEGHFETYVPPLFARVEDLTEKTRLVTVVGTGAAEALSGALPGGELDREELGALEEDEFVGLPDRKEEGRIRVVRCGTVDSPAFDVIGEREEVEALIEDLKRADVTEVGHRAWEILRIEAGRPAYGSDMDDDTIPVEAGIHRRAIDYEKGCYTGQEVIVRIRDRGRVNWHLRGLFLGDAEPPEPGTELFEEGEERPLGRVTSSVDSPRFGQTAGLGYVRREVEPPATLRLGHGEGPRVAIRALDDGGWCLEEGDTGRQ